MRNAKTVSVIGAGAWGTTLAMIASSNNLKTNLWTHEKEHKEVLEKTGNNPLLDGFSLPKTINYYSEFEDSFFNCDILILVVASKFLRNVCHQIKHKIKSNTIILSAIKGLEIDSAKMPYDILIEELDSSLHSKISILSGPNIAKEIAAQKPAATVIAAKDPESAQIIQKALSTSYFRAYTSTDIIGVELGGIFKNIIAIAAGLSDGLQLGHNSKAALMTRGMYEISKLALSYGAKPETLLGLSGTGDLITTCSSPLSRNYRVGFELANGKNIDEIISSLGAVAEGVRTCEIVYKMSKEKNIDLPITEQVYNVIHQLTSPQEAIQNLMERSLKFEYEN